MVNFDSEKYKEELNLMTSKIKIIVFGNAKMTNNSILSVSKIYKFYNYKK